MEKKLYKKALKFILCLIFMINLAFLVFELKSNF